MVQRTDQGMRGAQCTGSLIDLYEVAGQIRATLIALQAQARMANGTGH